MWKAILHTVKATFPVIALIISTLICSTVNAQQHIIVNKDNTRPETNRHMNFPSVVSAFVATRYTGYNDIQWRALAEQNTRKFIVEYSFDGLDFQSAGQVLSANGTYNLKHHLSDSRPLLYRVRVEELAGRMYYSESFLLNGIGIEPVKIYPTEVTGNVVNVNADFPVERVTVTSSDGQQMFAKDLNGARDFLRINIPSLNKGMYFMTFYGNGWKTTSKFII